MGGIRGNQNAPRAKKRFASDGVLPMDHGSEGEVKSDNKANVDVILNNWGACCRECAGPLGQGGGRQEA